MPFRDSSYFNDGWESYCLQPPMDQPTKKSRIAIISRQGHLARFLSQTIVLLAEQSEIVVVAPESSLAQWAALPGVRVEKMKRSASPLNRGPRALRSYLHWVRLGKHNWSYLEKYTAWFAEKPRRWVEWLHRTRLSKLLAYTPLPAHLRRMEEKEPPMPPILKHLEKLAPDFILVIPVVFPNQSDVDYLKAAVHMGIPTAAVIPSWDNLTTKGILHAIPDHVFIWNEIQKRECTNYHGLDASTVHAVGAPSFDPIYARLGLIPRVEFCERAKLNPCAKFVLWAASSMDGRDESSIVKVLAQSLPPDVYILVRPHPKYGEAWKEADFIGLRVTIWKGSRFSEDEQSTGEIVSSIEHSAAVIGLSTSMFLEAAVLDRPVALIHKPTTGTEWHSLYLHFEYLLDSKFVEICSDEQAMVDWLSTVLVNGDGKSEVRAKFAADFLRPVDPRRPAADVMAEHILSFASRGAPEPIGHQAIRPKEPCR